MNSKPDLQQIKQSFITTESKLKMQTKLLESASTTAVEKASSKLQPLQPHQEELQQLSELAGIQMNTKVFRILMELLNMGVDPKTIFTVLKSIQRSIGRQIRSSLSEVSRS